jgi:hypothetical protein
MRIGEAVPAALRVDRELHTQVAMCEQHIRSAFVVASEELVNAVENE